MKLHRITACFIALLLCVSILPAAALGSEDPTELIAAELSETDGADTDRNPIVIVPGIMASRLFRFPGVYEKDSVAWPSWVPPSGSETLYVRPCENQNVAPWSNDGSTVPFYGREYGTLDYYQILVDSLCDAFSCTDPESYRPVYFFSYDWRSTCEKTAETLRGEILRILEETGSSAVDIVCHSMGGLVVSTYLSFYDGDDRVGTLISCGTPYEGIPRLLSSAVAGVPVIASSMDTNTIQELCFRLTGSIRTDGGVPIQSLLEMLPSAGFTALEAVSGTPYRLAGDRLSAGSYLALCRELFGDGSGAAASFQNASHASGGGYEALLRHEDAWFCIGVNTLTVSSLLFEYAEDGSLYVSDAVYTSDGDGIIPLSSLTMLGRLDGLPEGHIRMVSSDHNEIFRRDDNMSWIIDILRDGRSDAQDDEAVPRPFTVVRIAFSGTVRAECGGEVISSDRDELCCYASFGRLDTFGKNDDILLLCLESGADCTVTLDCAENGTLDYEIRFFDEDGILTGVRTYSDILIEAGNVVTAATAPDAEPVLALDHEGDGTANLIIYADHRLHGVQDVYMIPFDLRERAATARSRFLLSAKTQSFPLLSPCVLL